MYNSRIIDIDIRAFLTIRNWIKYEIRSDIIDHNNAQLEPSNKLLSYG